MHRLMIVAACLLALLLPSVALAQTGAQGKAQRGNRGKRALARLDQNRDGQISRDEWTRKPKAFARLDANRDGLITRDELKNRRSKRRGRG
jgi:Ca2+-binding EF-hand superfamily protein